MRNSSPLFNCCSKILHLFIDLPLSISNTNEKAALQYRFIGRNKLNIFLFQPLGIGAVLCYKLFSQKHPFIQFKSFKNTFYEKILFFRFTNISW